LNVLEGRESLINLHTQLYTGILKDYCSTREYIPHLTVGRPGNNLIGEAINKCNLIVEEFIDYVKEISVEVIDENEDSIIEMRIGLV
jgi:2'-5' RNA ligase